MLLLQKIGITFVLMSILGLLFFYSSIVMVIFICYHLLMGLSLWMKLRLGVHMLKIYNKPLKWGFPGNYLAEFFEKIINEELKYFN